MRQHLKNIFDRTGVRSRRELVAKLCFSHYEPHVRDNEQRAFADRPIRGGPFPLQQTLRTSSQPSREQVAGLS